MKKLLFLLLTISAILILPGCKKILDGIIPVIPDEPTITAVGTPVGNVVTKIIGNSGGTIASADGNAELIFPAGALDNDKSISVQAVTQTAPNGVGFGYQFLPEGIKFLQPVTLKFHYTAKDLAATLGDLMGIAFQGSTGGWWRVNNFTNDTVNKIISAPIKHFTVYAPFDMLFINPPNGDLKVNKSMNLEVDIVWSDDELLTNLSPHADEDLAPLTQVSNKKIVWSANEVVNGNPTTGTLMATDSRVAAYKAPAKVPSKNPVAVSALVDVKFKYHGKTFNNTFLVSNINIIDGQKYLLELRETETDAPFVYTDTASLTVIVSADGKITVRDISNFAPETNPATVTLGDCTSTWIPDGIGEINITSVTGTISGNPGDPKRDLILQFGHKETVVPKFRRVCGGPEEFSGGNAIPGFPPFVFFTLTPDVGIYFTDDGQEYARLTLLE